MRRRPTLSLIAALSALLMLAAGLLPGLHGLALAGSAAGSATMVEVCSAEGSRWVALDAAGGETARMPAPGEHLALEHCPLCLWQAHAVGLPPPPADALFATAHPLRHAAPQGRGAQALAASRWALAQPRGPPASPSC